MQAPTNSAARARRRQRLIALLVAFYVLGLTASGLHFSLFRHEVCEHGESVHVATAQGDACEHRDAGAHLHANGGERSTELHQHCSLAPTTSVASVVLPRATAGVPALARALAAPTRAAPRTPAIASILIAPHHSPPTA